MAYSTALSLVTSCPFHERRNYSCTIGICDNIAIFPTFSIRIKANFSSQNSRKRVNATYIEPSTYLSNIFQNSTIGKIYKAMVRYYCKETAIPFQSKRQKLRHILPPLNVTESDEEELEIQSITQRRMVSQSVSERRRLFSAFLARERAPVKDPLMNRLLLLMDSLQKTMGPPKSPQRPLSTQPESHEMYSRQTRYFSFRLPKLQDVPPPFPSSPSRESSTLHYLSLTNDRDLRYIFRQNTVVKDFHEDRIPSAYAFNILCKIFAIYKTGRIVRDSKIFCLDRLHSGLFCVAYTLKDSTDRLIPSIPDKTLLIKTLLYMRRYKFTCQNEKEMVRYLFLSYFTYQTLRAFRFQGKKIRLAKLYNKPHEDGYSICQCIPDSCRKIVWTYKATGELSEGSLHLVTQVSDFFEVAVELALKHEIFIDISPNNVHINKRKQKLYLIDTLGFPTYTYGWNFLYHRLKYWTVLGSRRPNRDIFERITTNFPEKIKSLFRNSFPRKNLQF